MTILLAVSRCPLSQSREAILLQIEIVARRSAQHPPLLGIKQKYDPVDGLEDFFVKSVALILVSLEF